jgi:hypothetical protein
MSEKHKRGGAAIHMLLAQVQHVTQQQGLSGKLRVQQR